jgi:hypothetical protein
MAQIWNYNIPLKVLADGQIGFLGLEEIIDLRIKGNGRWVYQLLSYNRRSERISFLILDNHTFS